MGVTRYSFDLTADTGSVEDTAQHVQGSIVQVQYSGTLDTGAVITLTQDPDDFNIPVLVMHAGTSPWSRAVQNALFDTGGAIVDGSQHPPVFWGENLTCKVTSADTGGAGQTASVRVYTYDG